MLYEVATKHKNRDKNRTQEINNSYIHKKQQRAVTSETVQGGEKL